MNLSSSYGFLVGVLLVAGQACADAPLVQTRAIQLKGVAGKLDHLAVDSTGQRLFVANKPNNTLDIVDLKSGSLIKQIPDQHKVSGVSYSSDLDMIYVGNGSGSCNGFDGKTYQQVFSTKAPNADNVHYNSNSKLVYVGQDNILSVLNAKTGELRAAIDLPGAIHGFKIDEKANRLFAVLTKENMIAVIDTEQHKLTDRYPLTLSDAGSPIAQDSEHGMLFVGCPKSKPMIVIFDTKSGKEVGSVSIPAGVDDVHYDSQRHRLYASCSDQILSVIEKIDGKYEIVANIPTPKDSRTCVWSNGTLYLAVPKQDGMEGPEIRVFEASPEMK